MIFTSKRFFLFLVVGGFAAAVNFLTRIVLDIFFNFSFSIVLAYFTGMIIAYVLNRSIVFSQTSVSVSRSFFYFSIVNLLAVFQTWLVSVFLAYSVLPYFQIEKFIFEISHAIGISIPILTSYFGHKYLSFQISDR